MADSANGQFLDFKRMKIWVDKKSSHKSLMLYPRCFDVTWGFAPHWVWNSYKDTSDENIEVVRLLNVCWLNVSGQFKSSELSPGVVYEIAFIVTLTNGASGWELPVTVTIKLPDGKHLRRKYSLLQLQKPRGEWMELTGCTFQAKEGADDTEVIAFNLFEGGGHWKIGLIINGVIVRPKPA